MKILLPYLILGGYALLLYQWRKALPEALEETYENAAVLQEPSATE